MVASSLPSLHSCFHGQSAGEKQAQSRVQWTKEIMLMLMKNSVLIIPCMSAGIVRLRAQGVHLVNSCWPWGLISVPFVKPL